MGSQSAEGTQQVPEVMQRSSSELRGENGQNDLSAVRGNGNGSVCSAMEEAERAGGNTPPVRGEGWAKS